MNIWKIYQDANEGLGTFDSAVVVADTEDAARSMHPEGPTFKVPITGEKDRQYGAWTSREHVGVVLLGTAAPNAEYGVVLASFNAG